MIKTFLACAATAFVTLTIVHLSNTSSIAAQPGGPMAGAFTVNEIRFDESEGPKKPTPSFPKSWRFVGVSNGEKQNSNNLWFQEPGGNIFVLRGFTTRGSDFVINETASELHVGN